MTTKTSNSSAEGLVTGRHFETGAAITISFGKGLIQSLIPVTDNSLKVEKLPWIAPGLFDLQINGCLGHAFNSNSLTAEKVVLIADECARNGTTSFCPTLITQSFESLEHGLKTIVSARKQSRRLADAIPAIHLEGPYLSPEDGPRGAHPREFIRAPDWNEFQRLQEAAEDLIRLITLAPEQEGAMNFISRATKENVVVALGHTAASPTQIREAVKAGARLSTHLGNGSSALLPRHENCFFEQLSADDLSASIICDGHHLPPSLVKIIHRVKSSRRLILTCDASPLAGLQPGKYREWNQEFEVLPEGKIVVPGTEFLAGSGMFTLKCVAKMIEFTGVPLGEAVAMASSLPRILLGLPVPLLEPGYPAKMILLRQSANGDWGLDQVIQM